MSIGHLLTFPTLTMQLLVALSAPQSTRTFPSLPLPNKELLHQAITPHARLLMCNHPVNPTGVVFSAEELDIIAQVCVEADLLVIADEVYDHLIFDDITYVSMASHPDLTGRLLYVNSFSKTYAMTGWRIGYIAAPQALIDGPATIHSNCVNSVSWPTQRAALAAVTRSRVQDDVACMVEGYAVRRQLLLMQEQVHLLCAFLAIASSGLNGRWTPAHGV